MKRLCFLSPDIDHTRQVVTLLKDHKIDERHIYVIANEKVDLEDLPAAGPEGNDFLAAYERGLAIGGAGGLIAGLLALALPGGLVIGGGAVLLFGLYGAGMGGLLAGLVGADFPNTRLKKFQREIEAGKILVMADVPSDTVQGYMDLIHSSDKTVEVIGLEPPAEIVP